MKSLTVVTVVMASSYTSRAWDGEEWGYAWGGTNGGHPLVGLMVLTLCWALARGLRCCLCVDLDINNVSEEQRGYVTVMLNVQ